MIKNILSALSVLLLASLACGTLTPSSQPVSTGGTAAATTPPVLLSSPTGTAILASPVNSPAASLSGISLDIPGGWNATAQSEIVPESNSSDLPAWEIHPAYTQITLRGYPLQDKLFQPGFYIYPADQFGQMSPAAAQAVNDLHALQAAPGSLPEHMPFLPLVNAAQVFYSNPRALAFQNGRGIRYLTQYDQAPLPINNHELLYTFQGLTQDGRYYISAVLPVNAPFLSVDANPDAPAPDDAVPFDWNNFSGMPAYLQAVRQRLESTDADTFTPSLTDLDAMVQSLSVDLP